MRVKTEMHLHNVLSPAKVALVIVASAIFISGAKAQSLANFASRRLVVSGGEETVTNTSATIYHGFVDISKHGGISGKILRREFGAAGTNSVSKPVTINNGASKIFGTVISLGGDTQTQTNNTGKITTTGTLYGADFHITTSLSGFMVKGRAIQKVTKTIVENTEGGRLIRSTNQEIDVSLQGISIAPGGMRGFFSAD